MLKNVLQGHPFLKGDIVETVHSHQNYCVCVICLVHARIRTFLCSPMGTELGGNKTVFTSYCMPSAEWLTEFVSPGSEAMEKGWDAEHRAGCRLVMRELSVSLACRITGAACSTAGSWEQLLETPHSVKPHVLPCNVSFHTASGNY